MLKLLDALRRQFRYDEWANREVGVALGGPGPPAPKAVRIFAHILGAEWLWLDRMLGRPASAAVWPDWDAAECARQLPPLREAWAPLLKGLDDAGLAREVRYTNSKGERWSSTVADILQHVTIHSAYHRAQAALELRAAGLEPPYTDFIHAVRTGRLD